MLSLFSVTYMHIAGAYTGQSEQWDKYVADMTADRILDYYSVVNMMFILHVYLQSNVTCPIFCKELWLIRSYPYPLKPGFFCPSELIQTLVYASYFGLDTINRSTVQ